MDIPSINYGTFRDMKMSHEKQYILPASDGLGIYYHYSNYTEAAFKKNDMLRMKTIQTHVSPAQFKLPVSSATVGPDQRERCER